MRRVLTSQARTDSKSYENPWYNMGMTQADMVIHWKEGAKEAKDLARQVQDFHIDWAFFFWHLSVEKLLKGLIVQKGLQTLAVHDLLRLVERLDLSPTADQQQSLAEITTYNIKARYDDYKKEFYKKVTTQGYKETWIPKCDAIYTWLEQMYQA